MEEEEYEQMLTDYDQLLDEYNRALADYQAHQNEQKDCQDTMEKQKR